MHYYVYLHKNPETDEIVYVGKGCHGRAWVVTRGKKTSKNHQDWMKSMGEKGFIPCDWVVILQKNLTEHDAFKIETNWMHVNGQPKFNRTGGEKNYQAKLTDEQAREIFNRAKTELHKNLAEEFNISRSAVSMIATRKQWRAATSCLVK
jgi:hypothetical protein